MQEDDNNYHVTNKQHVKPFVKTKVPFRNLAAFHAEDERLCVFVSPQINTLWIGTGSWTTMTVIAMKTLVFSDESSYLINHQIFIWQIPAIIKLWFERMHVKINNLSCARSSRHMLPAEIQHKHVSTTTCDDHNRLSLWRLVFVVLTKAVSHVRCTLERFCGRKSLHIVHRRWTLPCKRGRDAPWNLYKSISIRSAAPWPSRQMTWFQIGDRTRGTSERLIIPLETEFWIWF